MAKLTGTDTDVAASRPAPGWTRWAHSAALGPATVIGPRCPPCVLAVAAAGTAAHRRNRPGLRARMLAWWHRHDRQSPPLAPVPDVTLPPTTVEPAGYQVRAPGVAGPGRATAPALAPLSPGHHQPGVAP